MGPTSRCRRPQGLGFTLVELCVTLAVAGVVTTVAWPAYEAQSVRVRRADALTALTRAQVAQERYRASHGGYSQQLAALGTPVRSDQGLYDITVQGDGDNVVLAATARTDGTQHRDTECREITLRLNQGFAEQGPHARCWMK